MALHQLAVKTMATQGHVIVCGYGRSGQALSRFLEREGIPLAALGMLNPVIAGAAMAFSSVSVVANALTLRRWRGAADAPAEQRSEQSQPVTV